MQQHPRDTGTARWRKSSRSNTNGGECVEIAEVLPGTARWRKSSHSNAGGGNCVEVTEDLPDIVPVRDSKSPHGPILTFSTPDWTAFIATLKSA